MRASAPAKVVRPLRQRIPSYPIPVGPCEPAENTRGAAGRSPPPSQPTPRGGGDGCRSELEDGGGRLARPPGSNRRRGRRMPTVRPIRLGAAESKGDELGPF